VNRRYALLLALLAAGGCGRDPLQGPAVGTLERDRIELIAESNDPIAEIAVREGDAVAAGTLVLRQDEARLGAQLARAEGMRDQARARLAELERGPRAERIREARARLAAAESALDVARRELERARVLATEEVRSRADLDVARGRHDDALARVDEARAALEELLTGATAEELDQARSALAAAQAEVVDAGLRVQRLQVRAPAAARVDALPFEIGERPPAGAVVAVLLAETGPPYARVYVPQPLRVGLQEGMPARVTVPGLARDFDGRLRSISREAVFTPYFALTQHDRSHLAYLAEVDLQGEESRDLPTGVPVEVHFDARADVARKP
jgi:HlyD family secretion protein